MWISFNYFPKQIHDAKTFDSCKLSTQDKIYFDLLEVIWEGLLVY
jgi:hypothetical protein